MSSSASTPVAQANDGVPKHPTTTAHTLRRPNQRWPVAHDLPQVQTLTGCIWRRIVLGGINFCWVCGLIGAITMWLRTLYAVVRVVVTRNAEPLPTSVVVFVACIAAYESYRLLVPPVPWLSFHDAVRHKLGHYPYFRFNTCVFEDELLSARVSDINDEPLVNSASTESESVHTKTESTSDLAYNFTPAPLQADDKALYSFHPHGVLTCGMVLNGAHHKRFAHTNAMWLVAENLFWFPVLRDLLKWLEFDNVSKQTFETLMRRGQNIGFLPGGFEEATLYARGKHRVFIAKRFGFIKLALQFGYKVYPAYTFGEEETFHAFPFFLQLRMKLNAYKVPAALFAGSPWCFFMPRSDVDLVTVVGTPLQLPMIKDPTPQDVQKYHALYVQKLRDLFDKHKAAYATDPHATLEVF